MLPKVIREHLNLNAGSEVSIESGAIRLKRSEHADPNWRSMEGMARGGESLTQALTEERAAENAHDDARVQGG